MDIPEAPVITDISADMDSICAKLGITNKALVGRMTIDPTVLTITVYTQDVDGFKFVDSTSGQVASQTLTYEVTT